MKPGNVAAIVVVLVLGICGYAFVQKKKLPPPPNVDAPEFAIDGDMATCPSSEDAMVLRFDDAQTDETRSAIARYEGTMDQEDSAEAGHEKRVQFADVNDDGKMDFITLSTSNSFCGASGCATDVFVQQAHGGYEALPLFPAAAGHVFLLKSATENGYRMLLSPAKSGNIANDYYLWQRTPQGYQAVERCMRY